MKNEHLDLHIRPWGAGDHGLLGRLMGEAAMTRHLGGPESPEKIRQRHERYCRSSEGGTEPMFVIELGPARLAVGSIGYWQKDWQGQAVWETGWSVLPEFQGQGIASRALALVVQLASAQQKHPFLHAFPSVENLASNAICRKAGFHLLGQVDFEYPKGHWMRCNDWRLALFGPAEASGEEDEDRVSKT